MKGCCLTLIAELGVLAWGALMLAGVMGYIYDSGAGLHKGKAFTERGFSAVFFLGIPPWAFVMYLIYRGLCDVLLMVQ